MGRPNGTDLIWKAIPFCKSDFEILQVEWFDVSTNEELKIKEELIRTKPPNDVYTRALNYKNIIYSRVQQNLDDIREVLHTQR